MIFTEPRKDWLRTYGAFVAIAFSLSAWLVSNRIQADRERDAREDARKADAVCLSINEGREDANARLTHFRAVSDTLEDFLTAAAEAREQTAALLHTEGRDVEARISENAATKYREWKVALDETDELLQPYPLLDCA